MDQFNIAAYIAIYGTRFDHEKPDVYQDAIGFVSWVDELLEDGLLWGIRMIAVRYDYG